jgi:hypothetical protein
MSVVTARQPVIILGMHRSGTSMVSELLDALGLFVGRELQDDHESTWFLDVNEQMMQRVSATWDRPLAWLDFSANSDAVDMTAAALEADVSSHRFRKFLGRRGLNPAGLAPRPLASFDQPWGWKDPRTVFTLPVWLRLFPGARLVYIVRNGVDVAKSLYVRETKLLKLRRERFDDRMNRRSLRSHLDRAGYKGAARCLTLQGSFDLWGEYVCQGDAILRGLSNPTHVLRYEDMLGNPREHLPKLAAFCELSPAPAAVEKAVSTIDSSRAGAFKTDPTTAAFYESIRSDPWMIKYGY